MAGNLDGILASIAVGSTIEGHNSFVEKLIAVHDATEAEASRTGLNGYVGTQRTHDVEGRRARDANDAEGSTLARSDSADGGIL